MLRHVMRLEWRNLLADRTLWAVAGVFLLVIGYGTCNNGAAWARFQAATLRAVAAEERAQAEELKAQLAAIAAGGAAPEGRRDPTSAGAVGRSLARRYAALPPGALAALAVGQSDLQPYYFRITTGSREAVTGGDEIENPLNLLSGRFDLAFVIVFLMPLLILALGYNLLSGEKESGTLAMTLAQPVALRTVVLGKVALRALVVVALAVGLALVGALASGVRPGAPGAAPRLLLWVGSVVAYGTFWFAAAVAVNALGRSSATNAMALAGVWLALVVVIPTAINVAATTLYPVPSRVELIQAIREASADAAAQGSRLLAKYYEDHPEAAPRGEKPDLNDFAVRTLARQALVERRVQPVLARYDVQLARQQAFVGRLRALSPAILAQEGLNDVAGSGTARHRHFMAQVDRFHDEWRAYFVPRAFRRERLTAAEIEAMPCFTFTEEPTAAVAVRVAAGMLGLLAPALGIGLLGLRALRRYPLVA